MSDRIEALEREISRLEVELACVQVRLELLRWELNKAIDDARQELNRSR